MALLAFGFQVTECVAQPDPADNLIEFRIAHDHSGEERIPMATRIDGNVYYVEPSAILSDAHIEGVDVEFGEARGLLLHVHFTEEGVARMEGATADNVGKRLALVVNGEAFAAPLIIMPIRFGERGSLPVALSELSRSDARQVARMVCERWPAEAQ